jgi:5'-3' exoribonuclease 2
MGIPYYFASLIKNHKNIVKNLESIKNIHNLYLDSNSIIYDSIDFTLFQNKLQFENLIIEKVIDKIHLIIKTINPTKNIIIAFDGVPPIAKLNQQKNRRYKSSYQNILFNKNIPWDPASITPGTIFMNKLNKNIYDHFNNKYTTNNLILSLTDIPGEGEHKLFEYIRNNNHTNDTTIIYGMDSDLIMLSLNHKKYTNSIYLYRETPHFINSLDSTLNPQHKYLIDINELANQIYYFLTDKTFNFENDSIELYYNKISDYIFICFLLGNDFNEHFPAINLRLNGLTILLDLYRQIFGINQHIIKDGDINWMNFKKYICKLAENEHNFIKENYEHRNKLAKKFYPENTDEEIELKFNNTPSWERNIEHFINPYEKHWQYRYYYALFNINIDENNTAISAICNNYLKTLQWTFYYYSRECISWKHSYNYHYPPLLEDLYKNIPYFNSELVIKPDKTVIHPHLLLSYVLPRNSLELIPNTKIYNYLLKYYSEYYKLDYEFQYAFCKYFWEGHVLFPKLDFDKFSNDITQLIN